MMIFVIFHLWVTLFNDIFSIMNLSFMLLKFELAHRSQKYGLQNESYTYDIGKLLLGDMRYTCLDPT